MPPKRRPRTARQSAGFFDYHFGDGQFLIWAFWAGVWGLVVLLLALMAGGVLLARSVL